MKYQDLLETPEGRAHLANIRGLIRKLDEYLGEALLPYADKGEIPGFGTREVKRHYVTDSDKLMKWLRKRKTTPRKYKDFIRISVKKVCDQVDGVELEDLLDEGLIKEQTNKQITRNTKGK